MLICKHMRVHQLPVLLLLAGVGACAPENISGQLAATRFGDLSNPSAERRDGRLELRAACGEPPAGDATSPLPRAPYLQQVTDGTATLVWEVEL